MASEVLETTAPTFIWSKFRLFCYSFVIGSIHLAVSVAALIADAIYHVLTDHQFTFMSWIEHVESDPVALCVSSIASGVIGVLVIRWLVGRHEASPWRFLGIRSCSGKSILLGCVVMAAMELASLLLASFLERPDEETWIKVFQNANSIVSYGLLFITMVVAAPVGEELFFRGFLLNGLRSGGKSTWFAVTFVSLAFAAVHLHYDLYDMTTLFIMAVVLAMVRIRTESIVPCIAMHALWNLVGFILLAWSKEVPN
ncbi:MAG: hypothetical protein JWN70_7134 [Planctomycetaceae bacterium]|nr:hypothetical protein [Planctomycetaceae bacterium]